MTSLYELVAKWRARGKKNMAAIHYDYANEPEAALAVVWTRITDDESTWPDDEQWVLMCSKDVQFDVWFNPKVVCWAAQISFYGHYWRPLTTMDTPPEDE